MMTESWPLILLLVLFAWAVIVSVLLFRVHSQTKLQQGLLATTQNDLRALCNAAVNVGERVNRLELDQQKLGRRQDELGHRQAQIGSGDSGDQSFEHALKLAKKGAGTDELMDVCGLSQGEAELLAMMQRFSQD